MPNPTATAGDADNVFHCSTHFRSVIEQILNSICQSMRHTTSEVDVGVAIRDVFQKGRYVRVGK